MKVTEDLIEQIVNLIHYCYTDSILIYFNSLFLKLLYRHTIP